MAYRDLVKLLKKNGAELVRTKGSHEVWAVGNCQTVVPHHPTVAAGTLRTIERHLAAVLGEGWLS